MTWLIFVDDLHLDFVQTGRLRDMLRTIVKELILEGDRAAMASSGPSALAIDPTADRDVLTEAIKRATGNGLKFEDIQAAPSAAEVRYRASIAISTAQSILTNAAPGNMAMLYISNGSTATVEDQLAQLTATARQAGIRIFAIDPRAFYGSPLGASTDPAWSAHVRTQQNFLRSLTDKAGGFTSVEGTLTTELRRVAAAMQR